MTAPEPIAYRLEDAATATGFSVRTLRRAIADGELDLHYVRGHSPRLLADELRAWIAGSPTERAS